jgi:hypothetical protein
MVPSTTMVSPSPPVRAALSSQVPTHQPVRTCLHACGDDAALRSIVQSCSCVMQIQWCGPIALQSSICTLHDMSVCALDVAYMYSHTTADLGTPALCMIADRVLTSDVAWLAYNVVAGMPRQVQRHLHQTSAIWVASMCTFEAPRSAVCLES